MNQKTVLLGVLGVSLLVVAQNLTPLMSVVFLGGRSPSLPLGIWLFIAFTLGLISSRLITIILQGSNSVRDYTNAPDSNSTPKNKFSSGQTFFSKSKRPIDSGEDWEQASKPPGEWQEERPDPVTWGNGEPNNQNTYRSRSQPSERPTEKPKDTVYDADYRVIIPPYGSPSPSPAPVPQPETTDWDVPSSKPSEDEDWV
jgi:hypothetical protein